MDATYTSAVPVAEPAWFTRLKAEEAELSDRLAKLRGFLSTPGATGNLSQHQRDLLRLQEYAMHTYLTVLHMRLADAGEAGHG